MQRSFIKSRRYNQSGQMALIGLIAVIAIIAILSAIMYPKIAGKSEYDVSGDQVGAPSAMDDANDTTCIAYQSQVADAISMYNGDHSHPPRTMQDLKKYGVTQEMIDTPNCNFQLPKGPPAYVQSAPAQPAPNSQITIVNTAPPVNAQPGGYGNRWQGGNGGGQQGQGNSILPTKMGRSIPLDGGSANIERQAGGDDNGN